MAQTLDAGDPAYRTLYRLLRRSAFASLAQTAREAAQSLTKKPLGSLLATKKLMRNMEGLEAHISVEGRQFGERMRSEEAREAFRAFAERRPPDFSKFS